MLTNIKQNLIICLAVSCSFQTFPLCAQDSPPLKKTDLDVLVVAVGHKRIAKYTIPNEPSIIEEEQEDGSIKKVVYNNRFPKEIQAKPFEDFPRNLYLKNKNAQGKTIFEKISITPNRRPSQKKIHRRSNLNFLLKTLPRKPDEKVTYKKYLSSSIGEDQTHALLLFVKNYRQKKGWEKPLLKNFNISPEKLPVGSILIYNSSPVPIEVDTPGKNGLSTIAIAPSKSANIVPVLDKSSRTMVRARAVLKNGSKKEFFYDSILIPSNGRGFLFPYLNPNSKKHQPIKMVAYYDELK